MNKLKDTIKLNRKDIDTLLLVKKILKGMEDSGLDPFAQMSGYITSGEVAYITRENGLRKEITKVTRCEIIEALLKSVY